jgi:multidrug efflux pump subunit AcrA (membrane-fusion protein)
MSNAELLKQLRIEKTQREDHGGGGGLKVAVIIGVALLVLAGAAVAGWLLLGKQALPVQTAQAMAPTAQSGAGAVLQATGYITARRQATVSAQITGTLTEVLIEEGDRVQKG